MNHKFPTLVTVLLLASSLVMASEPGNSGTVNNENAAATETTATGAPTAKRDQASAIAPATRTREEVYNEAVEAAKQHRSTFSEYLDFLKN